MYEKIAKSISESPVVDRAGYPYLVHPVTDGIPHMEPEMLKEITDWMIHTCDFDCDFILTPESMGIPLAVSVSLSLNIPYVVIRKRKYGLPGEITVPSKTGYSDSVLYINGITKGDRVVIIDDIMSTGNTLSALINALRSNDVEIVDVLVIFDKGSREAELEKKLGMPIKTMIKIGFENGKPIILDN